MKHFFSMKKDGIMDKGGKHGGAEHTVWIPFSSEQVKSADPVTYDDKGNVIPLSQRFDETKEDIRYQKRGNKKRRPSERGRTQTLAASSSEGLNLSGRVRLSHEALTQTDSTAKLQENTDISKTKIKNFINSGYKLKNTNAKTPNGIVRGLSSKIAYNVDNGICLYFVCQFQSTQETLG